MKFLLKKHKAKAGRYENECHGKYNKIFKILDADSLGFVEIYWEESCIQIAKDTFVLELNTEPDPHLLDQILKIKNVEIYEEEEE